MVFWPPGPRHLGVFMIGPLPTLHRLALTLAAVAVFIGIGACLAAMPDVAMPLRVGVAAGLAAGALAAFALVHDFHRRPPARSAGVSHRSPGAWH